MTELIAYCGLNCLTCPIFLATRITNKEEQAKRREEIARLCNELYGTAYRSEDIDDCDGCRTQGGRLFRECKNCGIRPCAMEKRVENCAHCADYVCGELQRFLAFEPSAKKRLDQIRAATC